jgi:hypothetical protein
MPYARTVETAAQDNQVLRTEELDIPSFQWSPLERSVETTALTIQKQDLLEFRRSWREGGISGGETYHYFLMFT